MGEHLLWKATVFGPHHCTSVRITPPTLTVHAVFLWRVGSTGVEEDERRIAVMMHFCRYPEILPDNTVS